MKPPTIPFILILSVVCVALLLLAGCGSAPAPSNSMPVSTAPRYQKKLGTARITGVVKFEGAAPQRKIVEIGGDEKCMAMHKEPLLAENLIVNDGRLQNVIVYVKKGWERWSYDPVLDEALIDQQGCRYIPHVLAVQTGQSVVFMNSDNIVHNVHGLPQKSPSFNFGQDAEHRRRVYQFTQPEMGVRIQCDVHKWMNAYVCVFEHPFHAVTNEKGEFTIEGLLPGEYELEAWHEGDIAPAKLDGPHTMKVTVKDHDTATVDFTFKPL